MIRALLAVAITLIAGLADARPRGAPYTSGFLWSVFQAATSGPLRMLQSVDGVSWRNRDVSYTPCNAGGYVRDPSIAQFSAQGKHYIVHTNTTFNVANTTFDLAVSSDDASTFTCVQQIDMSSVSSGANSQIWAPEWAHNDDGTPWLDPNIGGCPRVYVAASSTGLSDTGFQIYETHPTNCSDFSQPWSAPTLVTGTSLPNNLIDAYPVVSGSTINLWIKNENDKYMGYLTSTTSAPTSGYTVTKSGDWAGWGSLLEGESLMQMPGFLRIYLDAQGSRYTFSDSFDGGATWTPKQSISASFAPQHGTVIKAASVVPPDPPPAPTSPQIAYNIKTDGGAACNGDKQTLTRTLSITNGAAVLTASTSTFSPSDAGKTIRIPGANAFGDGVLVATILASPTPTATQVTLSGNASATLSAVSTTFTYGSDDAPAFVAFNTWARANQGSSNQVVLTIPQYSTCWFGTGQIISGISGTNAWPAFINNLLVEGTGATIDSVDGSPFSLGGLGTCFVGLATGCTARIQTASAGSSTVTLTAASASYISRFSVGSTIMVGGLDPQALFSPTTGFGDPVNVWAFEWKKIVSCNASPTVCTGTTITLDSPLTLSYSDQWPQQNAGDVFHSDGAGPATIWALHPSWDAIREYRGLTISQSGQTYAGGRSVTYRNATFTGNNGAIPTQNETFSAINTNYAFTNMETDKLIGTTTFDGVQIAKVVNQSTSTKRFIVRNSTFSTGLDGGAQYTEISDSNLGAWAPGIWVYGSLRPTDATTCTRCTISSINFTFGPTSQSDFNYYTKSGGTITMPNSGAQGSGPGQRYFVPGALVYYATFNTNPPIAFSCCESLGSFQVTTITADPWPSITDDQTLTTTVNITNGSKALNVPAGPFVSGDVGKTIAISGAGSGGGNLYTVITGFSSATDVTLYNAAGTTVASSKVIQWGTSNTYIGTNQSGGFPSTTGFNSSNFLSFKTTGVPNITCDVCNAGSPSSDGYGISLQAGATAAKPLGSYLSKQYTPTSAQGGLGAFNVRGIFKGMSVNVTAAATAAGAVTLSPVAQFGTNTLVSQNTPSAPAPVSWTAGNFSINLKQTGNRAISASGVVTCNGVVGAGTGCAGDNIVPPANMATMWIPFGTFNPYMGSSFTGAPTFTITLQTDPIQ